MIGNDVVDLTDPETLPGATHARFDARVFTAAERAGIAASVDPNRRRWRLWAAKEAAYKAARKLDRSAIFSPSRFEVRDDTVVHGDHTFALFVEEQPDWIHTVARNVLATSTATSREASGVRRAIAALSSARSAALDQNQSTLARFMAIAAAASLLDEHPRTLAIVTRDRIPFIEIHGHPAPFDLSLSHHGRFVAYALEPTTPS